MSDERSARVVLVLLTAICSVTLLGCGTSKGGSSGATANSPESSVGRPVSVDSLGDGPVQVGDALSGTRVPIVSYGNSGTAPAVSFFNGSSLEIETTPRLPVDGLLVEAPSLTDGSSTVVSAVQCSSEPLMGDAGLSCKAGDARYVIFSYTLGDGAWARLDVTELGSRPNIISVDRDRAVLTNHTRANATEDFDLIHRGASLSIENKRPGIPDRTGICIGNPERSINFDRIDTPTLAMVPVPGSLDRLTVPLPEGARAIRGLSAPFLSCVSSGPYLLVPGAIDPRTTTTIKVDFPSGTSGTNGPDPTLDPTQPTVTRLFDLSNPGRGGFELPDTTFAGAITAVGDKVIVQELNDIFVVDAERWTVGKRTPFNGRFSATEAGLFVYEYDESGFSDASFVPFDQL